MLSNGTVFQVLSINNYNKYSVSNSQSCKLFHNVHLSSTSEHVSSNSPGFEEAGDSVLPTSLLLVDDPPDLNKTLHDSYFSLRS